MKKVLILGSRGMLGQDLVKAFKDSCQTTAWDREEIDIADQKQARKKIHGLKPDVIINAAAYNAVDLIEEKPEHQVKAVLINGYAVGYLAGAAAEIGAAIVHYSTDYVFDGKRKEGYAEKDEPSPISKYGESKLLGERELQKRCERYYLIRTSRLFGPRASSAQAKTSFVELMIDLSKKNDEVRAVDEEYSAMTYTPDLACGTKKILDGAWAPGVYHLINEGGATWYEAALEIFRIMGIEKKTVPVPRSEFPRTAPIPKHSLLVNTKAEKLRSWQDALSEFISRYYK